VTDLRASVSVNGTVVTASSTRGPAHSIAEALAHASRGEQLYPGELFGTGTLPGCSGIEAGVRLRPGDVLELDIEHVGTIRHSIVPGSHT
jgi:2-keto-4-pentenoate hydratase/2-oxohepta-3-ene-1,7-dioic acid hydratase in catechol pathway